MARESQRLNIGRSQDFTVGEMKLVRLNGREIGVTRLHGGELRAVMNRCPHKGAPICRGVVGGVWDSTGPGEITLDKSRKRPGVPLARLRVRPEHRQGTLLETAGKPQDVPDRRR
jgi:hypothetical protein